MHVKICGINTVSAAIAAAEAGVDALGFVFASSPRELTPADALEIAAAVPRDIDRVAVFFRPAPGEIASVLEIFDADVVQADHRFLDPHVATRLLPVFREGVDGLQVIDEYLFDSPDRRLLFEGPKSGVGEAVDLDGARRVAVRSLMTLAGGLRVDNVDRAIRHVQPFGVDVSSGVESEPGLKDAGLIRDFVETVRETEKEMVTK